jgi:hypothetical protein
MVRNNVERWWRLGLIGTVGLVMSGGGRLTALDTQAQLLLTQPLEPAEVTLLEEGVPPSEPDWVTANTISQTGLTTPSLWWAKQQFGGKLLSNWIAKPETAEMPNRVDLLVNQQVWGSYNYLDRYAFLNQIGTVSKDFGYHTRVFNAQGELLAAYICDFEMSEPACQIFLDPSGSGAVRGATGALRSIGGGTVR